MDMSDQLQWDCFTNGPKCWQIQKYKYKYTKTQIRECVNITQYNTVIRFSCLTDNIRVNRPQWMRMTDIISVIGATRLLLTSVMHITFASLHGNLVNQLCPLIIANMSYWQKWGISVVYELLYNENLQKFYSYLY